MKTPFAAPLLAAGLAVAGSLPALPAFAGQPYPPVVATFDTTGADDPDLKAFIETLQKAVDSGDATSLKLSVAPDLAIYAPPMGFPDATTPAPLANPDKHVGDQRLDEAAILMGSADVDYTRDDLDSMVIDLFGTAIEPRTVGKSRIASGRLCSPAEPIIDRDKALAMAAAADVPPGNLWILSDKTDFHEKPDAKSPVIETLPANSVVPFVEGSVDVPPDGGDGGDDAGWYSVALPSGKIGFAADDASLGFQAVSVCFGKVNDHWLVTAIIVPSL